MSSKLQRKAVLQKMIAKVEEDEADTRIIAQANDRFLNKLNKQTGAITEKKLDKGGRQEMNFFLRSKLHEISHRRLLRLVSGEAQFGELL